MSADEGRDLRDQGIAQLSMASLWDTWPARADRAIHHLAELGRPFTADHVRELVGDPDRPNLMGARLLAAARSGLIRQIGFERSGRAERHAGIVTVWTGADPDAS